MEAIRKNKNIIIAVLVVLFFNAGLILFLAKPLYGKVQEKMNTVEQSKQRLENTKKEGQKWQDYQQKREELEKNKDLLINSMVKKETQIKLIERLEQIAGEEGVKIEIQSQIEVNSEKKDSSKVKKDASADEKISFSLVIDGEYNEILDYLYKLENLNYVVNIVSSEIKNRSAVPTLKNQKQEATENTKPLQAKVVISFTFQK